MEDGGIDSWMWFGNKKEDGKLVLERDDGNGGSRRVVEMC